LPHSDPALKQKAADLIAVKWWQLITVSEKAKEARPLEVVWVALYSVLVLMLMLLCVDVAAR
jgi:hypothetical protein